MISKKLNKDKSAQVAYDLGKRIWQAGKTDSLLEALRWARGIEKFFQEYPWCRPKTLYPWVEDEK